MIGPLAVKDVRDGSAAVVYTDRLGAGGLRSEVRKAAAKFGEEVRARSRRD